MDKPANPRKLAIAPLVVTVTEAATALSVSRTTLYQLFGRGELPFIRIAGRTMVPVAALHDFVTKTASTLRVRGGSRSKQSRDNAAA